MATTLRPEDTSHDEPTTRESEEARIERIAAKFEAEDDAADAPTGDETDKTDDDDSTDDASDDDEEHTEEDSAETSDDSTDDDDAEATDADDADDQETESDDASDDDAEATEEEDEPTDDDEDEDLGITQETRDALARRGVDPNFLKDVPEEHRPAVAKIVEKKIASVDKAFTQEMQSQTSYRAERKQLLAEKAFRENKENHHLVILDLIRTGGDALMEKVNDQLNALDPTSEGNNKTKVETYQAALDAEVESKRGKAAKAIESEEADYNRRVDRAGAIEKSGRDAAKRHKVPFGLTIEKLMAAEIGRKPKGQEDLSDDEVETIVASYAAEHNRSMRAHRREESKKSVQDRAKEKAKPKSGVRPPKSTSGPGSPKKKPLTGTTEDKMMGLARRLFPGAKDE